MDIYQSKIRYEQNQLSLIFDKDPHLERSARISKYFENLVNCHNVKQSFHGYLGYYTATFEYVLYNLLTNLEKQELPAYSITWEQDFYRNSFSFLNDFIELYKSIEM